MPNYEYACNSCGHRLEAMQKMSDAPLSDCPECGTPALTKLIAAAGFQLKGSGWYATDFKGGGDQFRERRRAALGAIAERRVAHLLHGLQAVAAAVAGVFVDRHDSHSSVVG